METIFHSAASSLVVGAPRERVGRRAQSEPLDGPPRLVAGGAVLRARGIRRFLIDGGGDVLAGEAPVGADGWKIAVEGPGGDVVDRRTVSDAAVATSAHHERYREIDGVRYSHIIDPRSGRPASWVPSVTVRFEDGAHADAYATAVSVLGVDEGLRFVERKEGLEALVITAEGQSRASSGW